MAKKAKKANSAGKSNAKARPQKKPAAKRSVGAPASEQDPKRRLGNYGAAGEHPLQGGRTTGIVGQTKQKNRTDQKKKK